MSPVSNAPGPDAARDRSRRRAQRARPVIALAAVAFVIGAIVGASHSAPSSAHRLASGFVAAWARGDYATMYADISPSSRQALSASAFAGVYRRANLTATVARLLVTGRPRDGANGVVVIPVRVYTRLFGVLSSSFDLAIEGQGEDTRVAWTRSLAFPGLRSGEHLTRHTELPPRAALLARDGSTLASGSALSAGQRSSPLGAAASAVVGTVGPIPPARQSELAAQGVPADALVGVSGLELAEDERLRGTPGGELLAGGTQPGGLGRVLASAISHPAQAVRTTVSPEVQRAAVGALGSQLGGIVAMDPSTGGILAVAGIGLNDLQPPGSTFKMVTLTGVLAAHLATPKSTFPYETFATLDGVKLSNANGESCGGTLSLAFAVSCNSVFAPLGAKLGASRLVSMAERFGFNHGPGVPGAVQSTIPPASEIQGDLAVGSSAIGQGEVQASVLEMATVAATIADHGRRPQPTFMPSPARASNQARTAGTFVTSTSVARDVRRMMIGVVKSGTGQSAAIPGVVVAGKTGTAELGTSSSACAGSSETEKQGEEESQSGEGCQSTSDPKNTDAWFASFAPALSPRIVVGVLLVADGAGGDTAAPVARQVLEAGLSSRMPG
jgi:peptidoglycan glycosyltransferase